MHYNDVALAEYIHRGILTVTTNDKFLHDGFGSLGLLVALIMR